MDRGKAKPFSDGQHRGGVGEGNSETSNVSEFVTETFCFPRNI